jgi:sec-independent protein translocase protein TatA
MALSLFGFVLGTPEIIMLLVLGVLLFGRKLPDIGRSFGKTMVEFKKGMKGIEDEVSEPSAPRAAIEPEPAKAPTRVTPSSAPRFDDAPPPSNAPPKV